MYFFCSFFIPPPPTPLGGHERATPVAATMADVYINFSARENEIFGIMNKTLINQKNGGFNIARDTKHAIKNKACISDKLYYDEDITLYRTKKGRYWMTYDKNKRLRMMSRVESQCLLIEKVGEEKTKEIYDEIYSRPFNVIIRDKRISEYLKNSSEQHFVSIAKIVHRILEDYIDKAENCRW